MKMGYIEIQQLNSKYPLIVFLDKIEFMVCRNEDLPRNSKEYAHYALQINEKTIWFMTKQERDVVYNQILSRFKKVIV
jgi:hypothetical protein